MMLPTLPNDARDDEFTLGCLDASGYGQKPNGRSEKRHGQKASTQTASLEQGP
jgi:hypothetical protein